ncbi:Glucitol operon repressor [Austwickia sp. TVS 96-490-7B]|uniref:DeoR/GlpR family DNA-binding transcription regulator n=1 Tax=Austwickia sp. TVS 96-490-7B TaxID=2830843 RepID=UPI001C5668AF|nr:DeoR/GlpR family DNA-binding transcription regulator [Austwickia sp. TVS 96-490-7B]MBW3086071.1 Glucitol operon repressor [Austwickia sp. TVS 96-490-7B]
MTTPANLLSSQRRQLILDTIRSSGAARVTDLAGRLEVSDMTIRRDLEALDRAGAVRRVHGGAVAVDGPSLGATREDIEPGFDAKTALAHTEKVHIARSAARMVRPGTTIALSAGTTTYALAAELAGLEHLTVVTNSTDAADLLYESLPASSQVILTGGVRTRSHALVGPIAMAAMKTLRVDVVFHGFHGMDEQWGFTCPNLSEVATAQVMIHAGSRLVALVDHSKWGVVALTSVAELSCADVLITDSGISADALRALRRHIGEVVVATGSS